jgi:hypothetical protein
VRDTSRMNRPIPTRAVPASSRVRTRVEKADSRWDNGRHNCRSSPHGIDGRPGMGVLPAGLRAVFFFRATKNRDAPRGTGARTIVKSRAGGRSRSGDRKSGEKTPGSRGWRPPRNEAQNTSAIPGRQPFPDHYFSAPAVTGRLISTLDSQSDPAIAYAMARFAFDAFRGHGNEHLRWQ